jgi:hypothetical protein
MEPSRRAKRHRGTVCGCSGITAGGIATNGGKGVNYGGFKERENMNLEIKTKINNQINMLGQIDGELDVARDCFTHFQNFQPTQTELDQYSTHGNDSVEKSRKALRDVIAALKQIVNSN